MDREKLMEMVDTLDISSKNKTLISSWVKCLPRMFSGKLSPTTFDIGDVFYYPLVNHPVVVVKQIKYDSFIGMVLTSNGNHPATLCQCRSRIFHESYWTFNLLYLNSDILHDLVYTGFYENEDDIDNIYRRVSKGLQLLIDS